jgi:hypothetical protein
MALRNKTQPHGHADREDIWIAGHDAGHTRPSGEVYLTDDVWDETLSPSAQFPDNGPGVQLASLRSLFSPNIVAGAGRATGTRRE